MNNYSELLPHIRKVVDKHDYAVNITSGDNDDITVTLIGEQDNFCIRAMNTPEAIRKINAFLDG